MKLKQTRTNIMEVYWKYKLTNSKNYKWLIPVNYGWDKCLKRIVSPVH